MAARIRKVRHDAETREKIRISQLINRLQDNAFGELTPELTQSQQKSIEILLRKALPDLSSVALTGADGGPIETKDMTNIEVARRIAFLFARGMKKDAAV